MPVVTFSASIRPYPNYFQYPALYKPTHLRAIHVAATALRALSLFGRQCFFATHDSISSPYDGRQELTKGSVCLLLPHDQLMAKVMSDLYLLRR